MDIERKKETKKNNEIKRENEITGVLPKGAASVG